MTDSVPSPPPPPATPKKPWYMLKRWWIIGALVVFFIIGAASGGGSTGTNSAASESPKPTPTKTSATPKTSTAPKKSAAPSKKPTAKKPTAKKLTSTAWAKKVEADLLANLAAKRFTDTCGQVHWSCEISDVSADAIGTLMVTVQEPVIDKATAEKTATNIFNFVGRDFKDLNWVVINNSQGVVAGQVMRSSVPLMNQG